jgi:hypothetical protein
VAIADFADLWRDQVSNLLLIELAQDPRLAGKENGCRLADPAVNGWGRMGSMKKAKQGYMRQPDIILEDTARRYEGRV